MNGLYKQLPPLRSDVFGLMEVLNQTDGIALVDDSSDWHCGSERGGRRAARRARTVVSEVRSEDVIQGSEQKLLHHLKEEMSERAPSFAILGSGPAASMIGTDLNAVAERLEAACGIPVRAADVTGFRYFDDGISHVLKTLAELFCTEAHPRKGTVNLLGGTALDLGRENVEAIRRWCEEQGLTVLAHFGGSETAEYLRHAGEAEQNLVLTRSGLEAARWMQEQYGIPYVVGLPFGSFGSSALAAQMHGEYVTRSGTGKGVRGAVLIGEQHMANAIRDVLEASFAFSGCRVLSFLTMDREWKREQDTLLKGEEDLRRCLEEMPEALVIADPIYRRCDRLGHRWIPLPMKGLLTPTEPMPGLIGDALDEFLERNLQG